MTRVVILGASGMLGRMVLDWLHRDNSLELTATERNADLVVETAARYPRCRVTRFDAESDGVLPVGSADWVINCIGLITHLIDVNNPEHVRRAIAVNSAFPHRLGRLAESGRFRIIQIATDCVFSGRTGMYVETDQHDPLDVYGKTKSLGEVPSDRFLHLRCSIIGPEVKGFVSLLSWFARQPRGARINGYTNHRWNGVTTLHFAKLCEGIIKTKSDIPRLQHIVPADDVSKANLLRMFAQCYDRTDVQIADTTTPAVVNRRLSTARPEVNAAVWKAAGYAKPPSVEEMVRELAAFGSLSQLM